MHTVISEARRALVLDFPFFGVLSLKLEVRAAPEKTRTFAVDGKHLFYNPEYAQTLNRHELMGVIAHEVLHCANGHHWRREHRDHEMWNVACDHAINHVLIKAGLVLPQGALLDPAYQGMSAEAIYDRLMQQAMSQMPQAQSDASEDTPEDSPSGGASQDADPDEGTDDTPGAQGVPDGESESEDGQPDDAPQGDAPGEDSGADGEEDNSDDGDDGDGSQPSQDGASSAEDADAQDEAQPNPANFGEVLDAPPEAMESTRVEWTEAVVNAMRMAQKHGDLPAGMERMLRDITDPPQDWRALLRRFVQQTCQADYDWRSPNTRYMPVGLYLPALRSEAMPEIVIAVDTSGSIDEVMVSQFQTELRAIIEEMQPERAHVLACDARVQEARTFERGESVTLSLRGGGGTDFRPVFRWVEDEGVTPACLIYLTDLDGWFPEREPDYPVLWVDWGGYGLKPPFGEHVEIRL